MIALHFTSSFSTLLGATGDFSVSSWLTATEAVVRVVLMMVLLPRLGMPGLLLATITGAGVTAAVLAFRLNWRVGVGRQWIGMGVRKGAAGIAILAPAVLIGLLWRAHGWVSLVVAGALVCAGASLLSMAFDKTVRRLVAPQVARIVGWRGAQTT
jgi:O-antigen/teichoic acid export membrane protein